MKTHRSHGIPITEENENILRQANLIAKHKKKPQLVKIRTQIKK